MLCMYYYNSQWFQQQYNSLLIAMKKYADDLASERSEKESLNGHIAELMISHKMMSSENTRLNDELQNLRENQLVFIFSTLLLCLEILYFAIFCLLCLFVMCNDKHCFSLICARPNLREISA